MTRSSLSFWKMSLCCDIFTGFVPLLKLLSHNGFESTGSSSKVPLFVWMEIENVCTYKIVAVFSKSSLFDCQFGKWQSKISRPDKQKNFIGDNLGFSDLMVSKQNEPV